MSNWRLAKSLTQLRDQINAAYPGRSKLSDGTVADARHMKAGTSDHIPNAQGVVTAFDCTSDPAHGCNAADIADALVESEDSRVKYIIYNRRMVSSYPANGKPAWTWRPYKGANPHTKHVHISVQPKKDLYDSTDEWALPESEPETIKNGEVAEAAETVSEKVITTTTTETPDATVEKKSIIETVSGNETVKTIASTGLSSVGQKIAGGGIGTGFFAAFTAFFEKAWPLFIFAGVLIVLGVVVFLVVYHHNHKEKQMAAAIASDPTKSDIIFAKK